MRTPPVLPLKESLSLDVSKYNQTYFVHLVYEYQEQTLSEVVLRDSDKVYTMRGTCKVVPAPLLSDLPIPNAEIMTLRDGFKIVETDNIYSSEVLARYYALFEENSI